MPASGLPVKVRLMGGTEEVRGEQTNQGQLQGWGLSSWSREVLLSQVGGLRRTSGWGQRGAEMQRNKGGAETWSVDRNLERTRGPEPTCTLKTFLHLSCKDGHPGCP